ncbi:transcription elongation factor GreA [Patescibacteria group bacterium]
MTKLVTQAGYNKLKEEIEHRKTTVRQEIAQAIKEAKEQGDLSENAEYSEAKSQQTENETRIAQLEILIKEAKIVEKSSSSDAVQIGSSVKVQSDGKEVTFHIVGSNEADPGEYKISNESPIGKALLGKTKGDKAEVETPGGKMSYRIISIS